MHPIVTITLRDRDAGEEAVIVVRGDADQVALGVSLRHGSDAEVVLGLAEAYQLKAALQKAVAGMEHTTADHPAAARNPIAPGPND